MLKWKQNNYLTTKVTDSATLYSHPRSQSISAYDMRTLEIIEEDDKVLSEPVLIYASNSENNELNFHVTAPDGQCVIGSSEECLVQENTRSNRGGLQSVLYDGQMLRIKYSGPDSALERFSITSIDPIVGDWYVTLESQEGLIPQAQAMKDLFVKVNYNMYSETITVFSD
ncbi:MAG: hypothetical protein J4F36_01330 [Nitrosopumilaceae archaeon]|nr:hypothetical protein [Nitrosopumilaceae archaeon]